MNILIIIGLYVFKVDNMMHFIWCTLFYWNWKLEKQFQDCIKTKEKGKIPKNEQHEVGGDGGVYLASMLPTSFLYHHHIYKKLSMGR